MQNGFSYENDDDAEGCKNAVKIFGTFHRKKSFLGITDGG
jgi:hypothetical protein